MKRRFFFSVLLSAALALPPASMAGPVDEARAGYLKAEAEQKRLVKAIVDLEEKNTSDRERLKKLVQDRRRLVETVGETRDRLMQRQMALRLERARAGELAAVLEKEWRKVLANPKAYPQAKQHALRDELARYRQEIARLHGELEKLSPQVDLRTDALARAMLDVTFTENVTELDLQIFQDRSTLGNLYDRLQQQEAASAASLKRFMENAGAASPARVDLVEITGPDGVVFRAEWADMVSEDGQAAGACGLPPRIGAKRPQRHTPVDGGKIYSDLVELEAHVKTAEDQISRNTLEIQSLTERIGKVIEMQLKLSDDFAAAYSDIAELKNDLLLFETIADVSVVIVEVALTGGAATAVRKSIEIGTDQLGKIAARRISREIGGKATRALIGKSEEIVQREFSDVFVKEAVTAGVRGAGLESIRKRANILFDDIARKALEEHRGKLLAGKTGTVATRKALAKLVAPLGANLLPSTAEAAAAKSLGVDLLEFSFDRAISGGALAGQTLIEKSGKNWNRVSTLLRSAKVEKARDLLPTQPADVLGIVASVAKAAFSYKTGLELDGKAQQAAILSAQYSAAYEMHDEWFRKRLGLQQNNQALSSLINTEKETVNGIRAGLRTNRQLYIPVNEGLTEPDARYQVRIVFSEPLPKPPDAGLGGVALAFADSAGEVGELEWTARLPVDALLGKTGSMDLSIQAHDMTGRALDGSPATIAFPKLKEEGFHFYDPGADECIKVPVSLGRTVTLEFEDLTTSLQIR